MLHEDHRKGNLNLIAIIDYGMGNLGSVKKAFDHLKYDSCITSDPSVIKAASGVVLPGVGAFGAAMENLQVSKLDIAVKEVVEAGTPFLGICLGMQLLMDGSEECTDLWKDEEPVSGLGIIPGRVRRFPDKGLKVPQIGWNRLEDVTGSILSEGDYVYLVHSYYCEPEDKADAAAYVDYGIKYCAAFERGNIYATQFHPEKSGEAGLQILSKFARRTAR